MFIIYLKTKKNKFKNPLEYWINSMLYLYCKISSCLELFNNGNIDFGGGVCYLKNIAIKVSYKQR